MTIPEACRLVMEAATMSTGTQIFVFDMGKSVKIAHLARRMIELAGLEVDKDIKIEYTDCARAKNSMRRCCRIRRTRFRRHTTVSASPRSASTTTPMLSRVRRSWRSFAAAVVIPDLVRLMKKIVPEFKSKNSRFEEFDKETK